MDVLSDFGASRAVKLDEVSKLLGFPGKFGIEGSQVREIYEEGRIAEIRDYCETDVLNTDLVYLRHKLHTADLTKEAYNRAISEVIAFIDGEKAARPYLGEFMEAWGDQKSCRVDNSLGKPASRSSLSLRNHWVTISPQPAQ